MKQNCSFSNDLALAHDYLIQMGGAERVAALMAKTFPDAPIYTSYAQEDGLLKEFSSTKIRESWIRHFNLDDGNFKKFFPLYPFAFRSFTAPKENIVWISASSFAKFLPKRRGSTVFCYCHAPTRFIWDSSSYLPTEVSNPIARAMIRASLPVFKYLDRRAAQQPDYIIANSKWVQFRIKRDYHRDSDIIHPPVDVERFKVSNRSNDFHLIVSRLVGYKQIDLAVEAFRGLKRKLVIIGDGTDRKRLEAMAPANVEIRGRVPDAEVEEALYSCRALIFPGCEDFGITPVEAMACGKPVIARAEGGALETIINGKTGIHFNPGTADALQSAVLQSEMIEWNPHEIRKHAESFSNDRFLDEMIGYMEDRL